MKKKILTCFVITCVAIISSCSLFKEKMTCDNAEEVLLLKENIKSDLVGAWALKLAAEDYKEYKYGIFGRSSDYEKYLIEVLQEIKNEEGSYYNQAVKQYSDVEILLTNIITESYDEKIDKCECSANVELTNSESKNKVTFDNERNSEGKVTGRYRYKPKVMLDEETNASDFIKKHSEN